MEYLYKKKKERREREGNFSGGRDDDDALDPRNSLEPYFQYLRLDILNPLI